MKYKQIEILNNIKYNLYFNIRNSKQNEEQHSTTMILMFKLISGEDIDVTNFETINVIYIDIITDKNKNEMERKEIYEKIKYENVKFVFYKKIITEEIEEIVEV